MAFDVTEKEKNEKEKFVDDGEGNPAIRIIAVT